MRKAAANRILNRIKDFEALRFGNTNLQKLHAAVISGAAWTKATAMTDKAVEAALFGEELDDAEKELITVEHKNQTTRCTKDSIIRELFLRKRITQLREIKTRTISKYNKTIREYDVDYIKFQDENKVIRRCISLCPESSEIREVRMSMRIINDRAEEEHVRKNAALVGRTYTKQIPPVKTGK